MKGPYQRICKRLLKEARERIYKRIKIVEGRRDMMREVKKISIM